MMNNYDRIVNKLFRQFRYHKLLEKFLFMFIHCRNGLKSQKKNSHKKLRVQTKHRTNHVIYHTRAASDIKCFSLLQKKNSEKYSQC